MINQFCSSNVGSFLWILNCCCFLGLISINIFESYDVLVLGRLLAKLKLLFCSWFAIWRCHNCIVICRRHVSLSRFVLRAIFILLMVIIQKEVLALAIRFGLLSWKAGFIWINMCHSIFVHHIVWYVHHIFDIFIAIWHNLIVIFWLRKQIHLIHILVLIAVRCLTGLACNWSVIIEELIFQIQLVSKSVISTLFETSLTWIAQRFLTSFAEGTWCWCNSLFLSFLSKHAST